MARATAFFSSETFLNPSFRDFLFELRHLRLVPGGAGERRIEFPVLPGEVLVVQVEPVVVGELPGEDLVVPEPVVFDLRVVECQRDGVIPGLVSRRDVDRDAGSLLQPDDVHVVVVTLHLGVDGRGRRGGLLREGDAPDETFARHEVVGIEHERSPAVVQQPVDRRVRA